MKISSNKILAVLAVMFSVFAFIAGNPFSEKKSFIDPEQLADSLIARKQNLKVLDLRSKKDFDAYHIPFAVNSEPGEIAFDSLSKNETIVLYSGRDIISKTAQYKFVKAGFENVYFLNGGIDGWMNRVIFPVLPQNANDESKNDFDIIKRRSMYFGGQPEIEGVDNSKKVYRREGC